MSEQIIRQPDQHGTTVIHVAGPCLRFGPLQRQRCSWCGYVMVDDDLSRMAMPLNEDGTVPEPPGGWPFEAFVEVTIDGGFRGSSLVEAELLPDGSVKVPQNCCMALPAELTGEPQPVEKIDLEDHSRVCSWRPFASSWRWLRCPECGRDVDTFGGNVG